MMPDGELDRASGGILPPEHSLPAPISWKVGGALLVAIGLAAEGVSLHLVNVQGSPPEAVWAWLVGLAALPVGLNFGVRDPLHLARPKADRELMAVLAVLALAALLRLPLPLPVPWGSSGPSTSAVAEFAQALRGAPNLFVAGPGGVPLLSYLVAAPIAGLAGDAASALRWGAAIEGLVSLLLLHLVARRVLPVPVAVLAALALALLPWHVQLSRGSLVELPALVGPLLLLYLLMRAVDSRRPIEYLLAGYAAGLCLVLHPLARIGLVAAFLYLLLRSIRAPGFLKSQGWRLLLSAAGILIFVAPFAA